MFSRCFNGVLYFALVNFIWIAFIEKYIPLIFGNILGIIVAVLYVIFQPKINRLFNKQEEE